MIDFHRIRALLDSRQPGHSLPQAFYNDDELFEFDLAAIHARAWFIVGMECEIPAKGSYLATTIGRSPIVVVRGDDGVLRGFHNSCRHRGAQICADGHGTKGRLVCPYHQWTYRLDGSLLGAGRMQESFDPGSISLVPIAVRTVAGTVYVSLAEQPAPFEAFHDALAPLLAPHHLENAKLAHECTLVERANWKLVMENARECYHCSVRHPGLSVPFPVTRGARLGDDAATERFAARMAAAGLQTGPASGPWWQAGRFPLNDGCVSITADGQFSVKKLLCEAAGGDIGSLRWALEAHSFCHAVADYVVVFSAMPTGPEETVVTCKWYVHKDAVEGTDYTVEGLTGLWNDTNLEDRDLAENNQRGINGLGYRPGPYSEIAEGGVVRLVEWYCAQASGFLDGNGARRRAAPKLATGD